MHSTFFGFIITHFVGRSIERLCSRANRADAKSPARYTNDY